MSHMPQVLQIEFIEEGGIARICSIMESTNAKKIFLVSGKSSFILSGAKKTLQRLLKDKKVTIFNSFPSDYELCDIERGISVFKSDNFDLVVAIGGGSVLDMAKLIKILSAQKQSNIFNFIKNPSLIENKGVPLVALPTTAGSGSQATHFAVVYVQQEKYSLAHQYVLPDFAIVDTALCYSAPRVDAASSALDALSQSIESYWSLNSTKESKYYAAKAIKLMIDSIVPSVNHKDKKSIQSMSLASHLSGKAINISKTTLPHALSYFLTSNFKISHGHSVALFLGFVWKLNYQYGDEDLQKIMEELSDLIKISVRDFDIFWYNLMSILGLEKKLSKIGIEQSDLYAIASSANQERLKNHPITIKTELIVDELNKML